MIERVAYTKTVPFSKARELGLWPLAIVKTSEGNEYVLTGKECGYSLPKAGSRIETKLLMRKENVL